MVDITSLKVRLARLRLGSELDDDPRLEDPARKDLDKKRGSKKKTKKASKDPYEGYNELDILEEIFVFLDVDPEFKPDISERYNENPKSDPLDFETRKKLVGIYRADMNKLKSLTNLDISAWMEA